MDTPSVFDLELADLRQDMILRQRRNAGEQQSFSERDYETLLEHEVSRARTQFGPKNSTEKGETMSRSDRLQAIAKAPLAAGWPGLREHLELVNLQAERGGSSNGGKRTRRPGLDRRLLDKNDAPID